MNRNWLRLGLGSAVILTLTAVSRAGDSLDIATTKDGVVVVTPAEDYRGNFVPNPDFTRKLENWKTEFLESNETKYAENHKLVSVAPAPKRDGKKAVELNSTPEAAPSQGVKAVTPLICIQPDQAYEFGADVLSEAPAVKIFIEGYREDPERKEAGNDTYPGFVRVYRSTLHVKVPVGQWGTASRIIKPPKGYQPSHVLIKLYCYWPSGKVYFTNVFLRPTDQQPSKEYGPIRDRDKREAGK